MQGLEQNQVTILLRSEILIQLFTTAKKKKKKKIIMLETMSGWCSMRTFNFYVLICDQMKKCYVSGF